MSTSSYDGHSSLEPNFSYEGGRSLAGISEKKMKIEINYKNRKQRMIFQNVHVTLFTMNYLLTDVTEIRRLVCTCDGYNILSGTRYISINNFSSIAEL